MGSIFNWPAEGSGSGSGVTIYANFAAFPVSAPVGTLAIDASTGDLYEYFGGSWQLLAQLGGGSGGTPYQETPAGLVNNSNLIYTLSTAPNPVASLILAVDGRVLEQNVDYTIVGNTITMAVALNFAQSIYAFFVVVGAGAGVTSLNSITGAVNLVAGTNITLTPAGQNITIDASGGGSALVVQGSRVAPQLITAVGGLSFSGSQDFTKKYIAGNGGAITVTANPQIAAGTSDGQELTIQSRSATDTVTLNDGTGLVMNGPWVGGLDSVISFTWDTIAWVEKGRQ